MTSGTGLFGGRNLETLEKAVYEDDGVFYANYNNLKVGSGFQRVFSFVHRRQVGFESFFEGTDENGRVSSSADIFSKITNPEDAWQMDRMRMLLHVKNFVSSGIKDRWLFMNIHPKTIQIKKEPEIAFLHDLLRRTGMSPQQMVVMLREHAGEERILANAMKEIQELGCLVLFDDFTGAKANIDRIWKYRPEIVKLDRVMIAAAKKSNRAKRMLNKLISMLHAAGCLVLMEKVETEEEAYICQSVATDFIQGRYWGADLKKPVRWSPGDTPGDFMALLERTRQQYHLEMKRNTMEMGTFSSEFLECSWSLADGVSLETASQPLLSLDRVDRVYLLDAVGNQVGASVYPSGKRELLDKRFTPIQDLTGATVAHRSGFQNAMRDPGRVHMSPPYRAIASLNTCTTLSMTVSIGGVTHVLCCDIEWREDVIL